MTNASADLKPIFQKLLTSRATILTTEQYHSTFDIFVALSKMAWFEQVEDYYCLLSRDQSADNLGFQILAGYKNHGDNGE